MNIANFFRALTLCVAPLILTACQLQDLGKIKPDFSHVKGLAAAILNIGKVPDSSKSEDSADLENVSPLPLKDSVGGSLAAQNQGTDFLTSLKYALDTDPEVISKRREIEAKLASIGVTKAQKDFQVGTTIYGGIEDLTDNTKGIALAIKAERMVFDGGKLDSQIESITFEAEAAKMELAATVDQRAYELLQTWLELEKYKSLQLQIDKRLSVLGPLIEQLEKVSEAGVGDLSKVTAARRTVSAIELEKTNIAEGFNQAQLEFSNSFGSLNSGIGLDYDFITNLVPSEIDGSVVQNSPALKALYARYQSSLAKVRALRAKDGFDVGFEARAMRPFAGSEFDSDESIGLVGRKTLFNGGMLEEEIKESEAMSASLLSQIKATYRHGTRTVQAALQNIESMNIAILSARENAKNFR